MEEKGGKEEGGQEGGGKRRGRGGGRGKGGQGGGRAGGKELNTGLGDVSRPLRVLFGHIPPAPCPSKVTFDPDAVTHVSTCPPQFCIISKPGKHTSQIFTQGAGRNVHRPGSAPEPQAAPHRRLQERHKTTLRVKAAQSTPRLRPRWHLPHRLTPTGAKGTPSNRRTTTGP